MGSAGMPQVPSTRRVDAIVGLDAVGVEERARLRRDNERLAQERDNCAHIPSRKMYSG